MASYLDSTRTAREKMMEMEGVNDPYAQQAQSLDVGSATPTSNWILPVAGMRSAPGDVSQGGNWQPGSFGYQKPASKGGHVHSGTDIYAEAGTSIVTPVAGTVTSVGYGSKSGYHIRIRGTDGIDYYFAHMQAPSQWEQGTKIQAGIHIGAVGNSGNASGTTAHLHFGMKKNGQAISPNDFLRTGTQQKHTPLSAIPGLNTAQEVAAWVKEELRRQAAGQGAMAGFDVGGIPGMIAEGQEADHLGDGFGSSFMRGILESSSNSRMGGGSRMAVPRVGPEANTGTAMAATQGGGVPEADPTNPVVGRRMVDNTEEPPNATG